ncbi:MAG TPA: branched-chain amino acid ABC transporter permease, partial [Devosia sp.]|nr:branched-chain amino acid ABC transporter permease [Devosia sp.]
MSMNWKNIGLFVTFFVMVLVVGYTQSWNTALVIFNMGLISAILSLGVNLQWGYAGLFNIGVMGFVALGGLAAVLVAMPPTMEAVNAGGLRILIGLAMGALTIVGTIQMRKRMAPGRA